MVSTVVHSVPSVRLIAFSRPACDIARYAALASRLESVVSGTVVW